MRLAGIVLAGGQGRRMGRNKAGVELAGIPLVERACETLRTAGCDPVVVADQGDEGPLRALLDSVSELHTDEVIVLACDLPLAGPAVARLSSSSIAVDPYGRAQPLCSRWRVAQLSQVGDRLVTGGERRMSALVDALGPVLVPATADELLNVNTPDDLARADELLR